MRQLGRFCGIACLAFRWLPRDAGATLALVLILFLSACRDTPPTPAAPTAPATPTPIATPAGPIDVGDGVQYRVLAAGSGNVVADTESRHFRVTLTGSDGKPGWSGEVSFAPGSGMAFPALDKSVRGMRVGEKRSVTVPSTQGWKDSEGSTIGGTAEVELLSVEPSKP